MNFDDTAEVVVSSMSVLGGKGTDIIQSAMDESDEDDDSSDEVKNYLANAVVGVVRGEGFVEVHVLM